MGIYDKVSQTLPPAPVEDPGRQEKVDRVKAEITEGVSHTPQTLAQLYREARQGLVSALSAEEVQNEIDSCLDINDFKELAGRLLGKDGLEELLYDINFKIEALTQMLTASEDADEPGWGTYGAKSNAIRFPDGYTLAVDEDPWVKVEDAERYRQWLLKNGFERQMTLHPNTTKGLVRDYLKRGMPEPEGTKAFRHQKIRFTKPRSDGSEE